MKAYRVYHIDNGKKVYICNRPGYWVHLSSDPEYAIPFLEEGKATKAADIATKRMAPKSVRYVEEYVENRKLVRFTRSGQVILAEMLPNYSQSDEMFVLVS